MTQFNIRKEAQELAQDAWDSALEYGLTDDIQELQEYAQEHLHQSCDGHEVSIYTHKAIQFCADVDTSDGEQWLDDCCGIAQEGDTFGQIACRIAFATLLVASESALQDIVSKYEQEQEGN